MPNHSIFFRTSGVKSFISSIYSSFKGLGTLTISNITDETTLKEGEQKELEAKATTTTQTQKKKINVTLAAQLKTKDPIKPFALLKVPLPPGLKDAFEINNVKISLSSDGTFIISGRSTIMHTPVDTELEIKKA